MKYDPALLERVRQRLPLAVRAWRLLSASRRRAVVRNSLRHRDAPLSIRVGAKSWWRERGDGSPVESLTMKQADRMTDPALREAARSAVVAGQCVHASNLYVLFSKKVGIRGDRLLRETVKFDGFSTRKSVYPSAATTQHFWIRDPAIGRIDLTREQVGTIIPPIDGLPVASRPYTARALNQGGVRFDLGDWSPTWTPQLVPLLARAMAEIGVLEPGSGE